MRYKSKVNKCATNPRAKHVPLSILLFVHLLQNCPSWHRPLFPSELELVFLKVIKPLGHVLGELRNPTMNIQFSHMNLLTKSKIFSTS